MEELSDDFDEKEKTLKSPFDRFKDLSTDFIPYKKKFQYSQEGDKVLLLSKKLNKFSIDKDLMKQLSNEYIPELLTPDDFMRENPAFFDSLNYYFDDFEDLSLLQSSSSFLLHLIKANKSFINNLTQNYLLYHQIIFLLTRQCEIILQKPIKIETKIKNQKIEEGEEETDDYSDDLDITDPLETSFFKILEIMCYFCNENPMVSIVYSKDILIMIFQLFDNFIKNQKIFVAHIRKTLKCLFLLITNNNKTIAEYFLNEQMNGENETQIKLFNICLFNIFENNEEFPSIDNIRYCLSIINEMVILNPSSPFLINELDNYQNLFSILHIFSNNIDLSLTILHLFDSLSRISDIIPIKILENNVIPFISDETMKIINTIPNIPDYFINDSINSIYQIINNLFDTFNQEGNQNDKIEFEHKNALVQQLTKCESFIQIIIFTQTMKSDIFKKYIDLFRILLDNLNFSDGFAFMSEINIENLADIINDSCDEDIFCSFIDSLLKIYEKGISIIGKDSKINDQISSLQQLIFSESTIENISTFSDSEKYSQVIEHFEELKTEYLK